MLANVNIRVVFFKGKFAIYVTPVIQTKAYYR